jgi:hypothetical protein
MPVYRVQTHFLQDIRYLYYLDVDAFVNLALAFIIDYPDTANLGGVLDVSPAVRLQV